jgi:hypothetical protein
MRVMKWLLPEGSRIARNSSLAAISIKQAISNLISKLSLVDNLNFVD